jgi:hypothetical protein
MSAPAGEYSTAGAASGWQGIMSLRTKPMDRPDLPIIVPRQMNPGCSKVTTSNILLVSPAELARTPFPPEKNN